MSGNHFRQQRLRRVPVRRRLGIECHYGGEDFRWKIRRILRWRDGKHRYHKGTSSGAIGVAISNKANNNLFREFPAAVTTGHVSSGFDTDNRLALGLAATTGIGSQFLGFQGVVAT